MIGSGRVAAVLAGGVHGGRRSDGVRPRSPRTTASRSRSRASSAPTARTARPTCRASRASRSSAGRRRAPRRSTSRSRSPRWRAARSTSRSSGSAAPPPPTRRSVHRPSRRPPHGPPRRRPPAPDGRRASPSRRASSPSSRPTASRSTRSAVRTCRRRSGRRSGARSGRGRRHLRRDGDRHERAGHGRQVRHPGRQDPVTAVAVTVRANVAGMREVFTAEQVRAAERVVLARVPPGALMRRAAFGLAVVARRMLADRRRAARRAARGSRRQRRRRPVGRGGAAPPRASGSPPCCSIRSGPTPAGWPRCAGRGAGSSRPGPTAPPRSRGRTSCSTASSACPAAGRCARPRPSWSASRSAGSIPVLAVDSPSGVDPDTGAVDGPAVTAAATVTFGALKPVHVLAAHRCGPVDLVDIGLGPELPDAARGRPRRGGRGGALAGARPDRRQVHPGRHRRRGRLGDLPGCGRAGHRVPPCSRPAAWCASPGRPPTRSAPAGPRSSPPTTSPTPGAPSRGRSGPGSAPTTPAGRCSRPCWTATSRCASTPTASPLLGQHADLRAAVAGRPVVLTPHDREFARVAGEVGTDRVGGRPAGRGGARGDGAAQGQRHGRRRPGRPDARAPVDDVVGGHGGFRRRADRDHRRAAGRRARAVVGGGLRRVRARPGRRAGGGRCAGPVVGDPARDHRRRSGRSAPPPTDPSDTGVRRALGTAARSRGWKDGGMADLRPASGAAGPRRGGVDLAAVRHNVAGACAAAAPGAAVMAVVKADGYGHGAVPVARAALDAGATWLGVCTLDEALELRGAGHRRAGAVVAAPARRGLRARRRRGDRPVRRVAGAPGRRRATAHAGPAARPACTSRPTPG